jgi:predicted transcriptional regulator
MIMAEALALRILQTMQHASDVEPDYLAFRLGATTQEISERLDELVERGVVREQDGKFNLEPQSQSRRTPV